MNTDINKMIDVTRMRGNTTWILESAIKNPNIIIIARNAKHKEELYKKLQKIVQNNLLIEQSKKPWYKKAWEYFFPKKTKVKYPSIACIHDYDKLRGIETPIVFDLYSIF